MSFNKASLNKIFNNPGEFITSLVSIAALYSHLAGWRIWFDSNSILSPISLPEILYVSWFILFAIINIITIFFPEKIYLLVASMIFAIGLNINILTPYWYNYILLLVFSKNNLKMLVWLLGIQEIWAGLNKFNPGYKHIVTFFSSPFESYPFAAESAATFTLLVPILEIAIGIGIIFRCNWTRYLTLLLHGGALLILSCLLNYGEVVWFWNILIISLVWFLYYAKIEIMPLKWGSEMPVVILLALVPFSYGISTLAYPFSYRMYPGDSVLLEINGSSYVSKYYQKTRIVPYLSVATFGASLEKECLKHNFENAKITAPGFLWRSGETDSYSCENGELIKLS